MAKSPSQEERDVDLTPEQMRRGVELLERRIREIEEFDFGSVRERGNPSLSGLASSIDQTLVKIFRHGTPRYNGYARNTRFDYGPISISRYVQDDFRPHLLKSRDRALEHLRRAVINLQEDLEVADVETSAAAGPAHEAPVSEFSNNVFLVHGQDGQAKAEVARFLERTGLKVIILHEQPNEGRTIIEKFEKHGGAAGFAVVLLTPDDKGGSSADGAIMQRRARQNVIGEMFWFAGKLGRKRVCALKRGELEIPTDFSGIVYTDMDDRGAWKQELLKELSAAGYVVDWAKALT